MAQARRNKASASRRGSGLGMFSAGLVVGAVAASFYFGSRSDDPGSIGRGIEQAVTSFKGRSDAASSAPRAGQKPAASTSFDFYEVLPEIEQIIPDYVKPEAVAHVELPQPDAPPTVAPRQSDEGGEQSKYRYILQAGSFARHADADALKAQLALQGLETAIQKVTIEGRGDFYRVRLGPFNDASALKSANERLAATGIKALRLRVSGG